MEPLIQRIQLNNQMYYRYDIYDIYQHIHNSTTFTKVDRGFLLFVRNFYKL